MINKEFHLVKLVVRGGVEPPTFRFSGGRSYRLSYLTWLDTQRAHRVSQRS